MMRRMAAWAVTGMFCLLPVTSLADELKGTRTAAGFVERANLVRATLHEGYIKLVVERRFENQSPGIDEAQLLLEVPESAVATGLRTQGKVADLPVWYAGTLFPAAVAAARYKYLTGYGEARPRDPALLYWISPTTLGLQVFPCAPNDPKVVEYTLQLPMKYEQGRYSGFIEAMGTTEVPATVELRSGANGATALLDGIELANNATGIRRQWADGIAVELRPNAAQPISAELAIADLLSGRSYVRAEVRAAQRISSIPVGARLVFIFDQSRSVGDTWAAQRSLFDQLVSQFPRAEVFAVGFDRVARNITEGFVPVARAKERVAAFPAATRNGSRVDLALAAVNAVLQKHHAKREHTRLFLLTDALNPSAIATRAIARQIIELPALAQVAETTKGSCFLSHRVEHDWLEAVESTGGTAWEATVADGGCEKELEELARPKRYFLQTMTLDSAAGPVELPESLDEGEAFEFESVQSGKPKALQLEAKLWGKAVTKRWGSEAEAVRVRAAFAAARDDGAWELTEAERLRLAMLGGAVTSMTSYLAIEPGVRPSTAGFEDRGGQGQGFGLGSIGTLGHGAGIGTEPRFDPEGYLAGVVDRLRRRCGISYQRVTVELETSYGEILDVVRSDVPDSPPSASGCLAANLWDEELPRDFAEARARYVVVR